MEKAQKFGQIVVKKKRNRQSGSLEIGDHISIERLDRPNQPLEGVVAYVGAVTFEKGIWTGVRLTGDSVGEGHNNGKVKGKRYFACESKSGLFFQTGSSSKNASNSATRSSDTRTSRNSGFNTNLSIPYKNTTRIEENRYRSSPQSPPPNEPDEATPRDETNEMTSLVPDVSKADLELIGAVTSKGNSPALKKSKSERLLPQSKKKQNSFRSLPNPKREEILFNLQKEKEELMKHNEDLVSNQLSIQLECLKLRDMTLSMEKDLSKSSNALIITRSTFSREAEATLSPEKSEQKSSRSKSDVTVEVQQLKFQLQSKNDQLKKIFSEKSELGLKNEELENQIMNLQTQLNNSQRIITNIQKPKSDTIKESNTFQAPKPIDRNVSIPDVHPTEYSVEETSSSSRGYESHKNKRDSPVTKESSGRKLSSSGSEMSKSIRFKLSHYDPTLWTNPLSHNIENVLQYDDDILTKLKAADENRFKTKSRRISNYLSRFKWYNPQRYQFQNKGELIDGITGVSSKKAHMETSLWKAWTFYEHYTLARYKVTEDEDKRKVRALPGSLEETELYPVFGTSEKDLDSWGVGVRLYFNTLKQFGILFIILGLINIPTIRAFHNREYGGGIYSSDPILKLLVQGSAICASYDWVPCETCDIEAWPVEAKDVTNGLFRKQLCDPATKRNGIIHLVSLGILSLGFVIMNLDHQRKEQIVDQNKLSSSDYTIVVKNPPKDATDPDKWRTFFAQFDDHKPPLVTISLNNEKLIEALVNYRFYRRKLEFILPDIDLDAEDEDDLESLLAEREAIKLDAPLHKRLVDSILKKVGLSEAEEVLYAKMNECRKLVQIRKRRKYTVTRVYVTMETEKGQRSAIKTLDIGDIALSKNKANYLFDGKALNIGEASEATAIRWLDQSTSRVTKFLQRVITFLILFLMIGFITLIILELRKFHVIYASLVIKAGNSIGPKILLKLVTWESHSNVASIQLSMFMKTTLFRWINTVMLILIITPTPSIIAADHDDLIPTVASILFLETITQFLRLLDIGGNIKKHYTAPRARSQEEINSYFQGTPYNLAERYTDITKNLLFCAFYSVIYPPGYFIGAVAFLVQYYVDKFCLLRVWASAPDIGDGVSKANRQLFLRLAVVICFCSSAYFWTGKPFDNLCEKPGEPDIYIKCNQSSFRLSLWGNIEAFEWVAGGTEKALWMTEDQRELARYFGWFAIASILFFILDLMRNQIIKRIVAVFRGSYKPVGKDMQMDFSSSYKDKSDLLAYIPQVLVPGYLFPCFACNVEDFKGHDDLVGWSEDSINTFDYYDLTKDVPGGSRGSNPVFSIAKYYPRFHP